MTKSVKITLIILSALSIIGGLIQAFSGSEFSDYFFGLFIGVTLLGTVLFYKETPRNL